MIFVIPTEEESPFVAHFCWSTCGDSSFLGMTKSMKSFVIPTEEESLFVAHFCWSTCGDSSFLGMTKSMKSFVIPTEEESLFVAHICCARLLLTFVALVCCSLLLRLFVANISCSTRLDSSFLGMTKSLKSFVIPTEEESQFVAHFCCACLLLTFVALVCCSLFLLNSFRFLVPRNDKIHEEFCHCFASSFLVSDGGGVLFVAHVYCSILLLTFLAHFSCSTRLDSSFLGMTKSLMSFVIASPVRSLCPT
jgi:hypothetical protein